GGAVAQPTRRWGLRLLRRGPNGPLSATYRQGEEHGDPRTRASQRTHRHRTRPRPPPQQRAHTRRPGRRRTPGPTLTTDVPLDLGPGPHRQLRGTVAPARRGRTRGTAPRHRRSLRRIRESAKRAHPTALARPGPDP